MPATSARIVPLIALASRDSSAAANVTWPSATAIATRGVIACVSVPSGPFTVILSVRDLDVDTLRDLDRYSCNSRHVSLRRVRLRHVADDFAAHALGAGLAIRHHAA